MNLPIPLGVLYAGLAGCLLALIIAAATNGWSLRVFFLLALRLAIGWHFLFEGMHKIHSQMVGPSETNKPFSSEMYFKLSPGPLGAMMRKQTDDPAPVIAARATAAKSITPEAFAKLPVEEQAKDCPEPIAKELSAVEAQTEEAIRKAAAKNLAEAKTAVEKAENVDAKKKAEATLAIAQKQANLSPEEIKKEAAEMVTAAKAKYARWVYGAEGRDTKVKFVTGDVALTAPERLQHLDWLRHELAQTEALSGAGLGNGYGIEQKRAAELRTEVITAESDLAKDSLAFSSELRKDLTGGEAKDDPAPEKRIVFLDKVTMWTITAIGACLLAGFLTRPMCLIGAGFLVMTYLTHPPFPWFPLPPNTEGNPLFINKNVIEALALLVIATFPTGRWLGLDSLFYRLFCRRRSVAA